MAHATSLIYCACLMWLMALTSQSYRQKRDKADQENNPSMVYQYQLTSNSHFGRIPYNALPGSEVPIDAHHVISGQSGYLKLRLYDSKPTAQLEDKHMTNSTHQPLVLLHSLPTSLQWDISGEGWGDVGGSELNEHLAFSVNNDMSIILSNPARLLDLQEIAFWVVVVMPQKGIGAQVMSNPLAFIISIDYEQAKQEGAAVYAGVVVLAVCLIALLIPLTVRTKRRMREGKPLCVCGSSSQKKNEQSAKSDDGKPVTGAYKEDIAVLYNEDHYIEDQTTTSSTIQSHNIKSISEPHFQPKWLDPHYKHEHQHPNYHKPRPLHTSLSTASLVASSGVGTSGILHPGSPLTTAIIRSPSRASLANRLASVSVPQRPSSTTVAPASYVEKL